MKQPVFMQIAFRFFVYLSSLLLAMQGFLPASCVTTYGDTRTERTFLYLRCYFPVAILSSVF